MLVLKKRRRKWEKFWRNLEIKARRSKLIPCTVTKGSYISTSIYTRCFSSNFYFRVIFCRIPLAPGIQAICNNNYTLLPKSLYLNGNLRNLGCSFGSKKFSQFRFQMYMYKKFLCENFVLCNLALWMFGRYFGE
jgi:hypothetical protein